MKHKYKAIPLVLALALGLSPLAAHAEKLHTVKTGDTLWGISNEYKVSVNEIKTWNKLNDNILFIGQKLVIDPTKNNTTPVPSQTYTVKAGDYLYSIATQNKVTVADLQKWNNLKSNTIYVGQKLQIQKPSTPTPTPTTPQTKPPTTQTYTVKSGDTLYSLSRDYKVSVADLQKWNKLDSTTLKVGQKLTINGVNTQPETPTTTPKTVGIVKATTLNVRSGAGASHGVIGTLKNNTTVTILNQKTGWTQIESGKLKGWVSSDFLTIQKNGTPVTPPKEEIKTKTLYQVDASGLNVRKEPTTGNNVIEVINKGTVVEELERKGTWSYVAYGSKKGWVSNEFLKKKTAVVTKNKTIVIDPGHGGSDPGAPGTNGFNEEDANLAISLVVQRELLARGYNAAMIRTTDTECNRATPSIPELKCRVDKSAEYKGDIFVSIHANSATQAASGTETYYASGHEHSAESLRLANVLHKHYQPAFGSVDRKVKQAGYYVIKQNTMPSVLLEIGFMNSSSDLGKLRSIAYQEKVGKAIVDGIDEYFGF